MHTALALLCACTISSSILMLQAKEDPAIQTETSRPMAAMPKRPVEKKTTDSEESTDNGFASNTQESGKSEEKASEEVPQQKGEQADENTDTEGLDEASPADVQTNWTWLTSQKDGCVLYRLYNPNSGEHFYTSSAKEREVLISSGWKDEDTAWSTPVEDGEPVYRLYNPNASDHHYTKAKTRETVWFRRAGKMRKSPFIRKANTAVRCIVCTIPTPDPDRITIRSHSRSTMR